MGLFVCSTAIADETFCGVAKVLGIRLLPSDKVTDVPLGACLVALEFTTQNGQTGYITATAVGTQLNLALLKACNFGEQIYMCIVWRFATSAFRVSEVTFICPGCDSSAASFPRMTPGDVEKLK